MGGASNQKQYEVNSELNDVVAEVLESHNTMVKAAHSRHLVGMMQKSYKFFKTAFINLIDKILVIEEKD